MRRRAGIPCFGLFRFFFFPGSQQFWQKHQQQQYSADRNGHIQARRILYVMGYITEIRNRKNRHSDQVVEMNRRAVDALVGIAFGIKPLVFFIYFTTR